LKYSEAGRFSMPTDEERSNDPATTDATRSGHYFLGVGGCGNNLIDAILRRRATTDGRWERILAGQGMVNADVSELLRSYYFSEWHSEADWGTVVRYAFGRGGAGGDDRTAEHHLREHLDSASSWDDAWGADLRLSRLADARAVWFLHGLTGGTGAGATPVLADELASEWDRSDRPSLLGVPILDLPGRIAPPDPLSMRHVTALTGFARLRSTVDAIVPLDNDRLRLVEPELAVRIDGARADDPARFETENGGVVGLLELLCLPDAGRGERLAGHGTDVLEVERHRPTDDSDAPILAPAVATGRMEQPLDATDAELLVVSAVKHGRLVEFDPETASGVTLVCYGPPEGMETRTELLWQAVDEWLDADVPEVGVQQVAVDGLDAVHLLCFFRDPHLDPLDRLHDAAVDLVDADTVRGERLRDHWESIQRLME
jgi:hypothetical protein